MDVFTANGVTGIKTGGNHCFVEHKKKSNAISFM